MNERHAMSCEEFGGVAAELGLGVLTGRGRAQAIAHLDACDRCREYVRQLSLAGEELLGLLPGREPPAGFETRVMGRVGHPPTPRKPRWTRRMLGLAAVALVAVACGVGGWGLRGVFSVPAAGGGRTAQGPLRSATLLTAGHQAAGTIFLYGGNPRWLYMDVDADDAGTQTIICQVVTSDGHVITVGSFRLDGGYGSWGSPAPAGPGTVTGARLTDRNGTIMATGSFAAAR